MFGVFFHPHAKSKLIVDGRPMPTIVLFVEPVYISKFFYLHRRLQWKKDFDLFSNTVAVFCCLYAAYQIILL